MNENVRRDGKCQGPDEPADVLVVHLIRRYYIYICYNRVIVFRKALRDGERLLRFKRIIKTITI